MPTPKPPSKEKVLADNPHFIGEDMTVRRFSTAGGHICCDIECLADWPTGERKPAMASYQYFNNHWVLIAN